MKIILTILYSSILTTGFCQTNKSDSTRKAEKEQWRKEREEWKIEYDKKRAPALADSFHIIAVLKDFNFGVTCGSHKGAGAFVFKIKDSDKKEFIGQTVMVIIPCAHRYQAMIKKKKKYRLTVTPTHIPGDATMIWGNYEKYNYKNLYEIDTQRIN